MFVLFAAQGPLESFLTDSILSAVGHCLCESFAVSQSKISLMVCPCLQLAMGGISLGKAVLSSGLLDDMYVLGVSSSA